MTSFSDIIMKHISSMYDQSIFLDPNPSLFLTYCLNHKTGSKVTIKSELSLTLLCGPLPIDKNIYLFHAAIKLLILFQL